MTTPHDPHHEAHGDEHHGHGNPWIQHHYDDAQHQFESGKLGIWLFLAQEVLFFSALFVAYVLYRVHHPEIYSYAHKYLDVKYGAINTAVLIFSSLTAAWAVRAAQLGQKKLLVGCIAVTIGCALTFLCIKYVEYSHKVHEHILFGRYFDPCVSPGGNELLTKRNECPGSKSTVEWDVGTAKASTGCYQIDKFDQDAASAGWQADCVVEEVVAKVTKEKVTENDPATGKPKQTVKSTTQEVSRKPIANRCVEESLETGGEPETGKHEESKMPCWKPGQQPAVCPDIVEGPQDKPPGDRRSMGYAVHPQGGILVVYGDHEERGDEVEEKNANREVVKTFRIEAKCKEAPKAAPAADLGAVSAEHEIKLGQKQIAPRHQLTTHEEHELESMGPPPEHTNMFFTIYFAMTGLHGVHVLVGVFVFIWLLIRAMKGHFSAEYFGPVDYAALYWHIVDLIWIFLFPLLYLIH